MNTVKYTLLISLLICFYNASLAQVPNPQLLHHPADWRFERIDFPLDFAPDLKYEGFEELRFAPGMFDRASDTYFTYLFTISLNTKSFTDKDLEVFLLIYFKGLAKTVSASKNMKIDVSKIKLELKADLNKVRTYHALLKFLDVFNEGEEVLLNLEIDIKSNKHNSYIIALVSPKPKSDDLWEKLYKIKDLIDIKL